jgi:hypothetical protein
MGYNKKLKIINLNQQVKRVEQLQPQCDCYNI